MAEDDLRFTIQARGSMKPGESPGTSWASVIGLPAEIKDLLWAQEQAADLLPYQLPGARRPSLGTVYVRQDVGSGLDEAPVDQPATPKLDEHRQLVEAPVAPTAFRVAVRPPSKPMRSALDHDEHLVITGGPGQGKSTLTLRLTADIVKAWSARDDSRAPIAEPVLPLRIPARVLAAHLGLSISQTLASSASAEYGRYLSGPLEPALFAQRVAGCRWLLLIDALDEVADSESRARIVHTLAAWACKDTYRVVLTTRPAEGGTLAPLQRAGAVRYELLPFDDEGLRKFAEHWFEAEDQTRTFLRQIRDAHLSELVAVPLLATIAAIVFEQHGERPLPGNKFHLYESYLAFIRSSRPVPETFECHRIALIEHLGRTTLRSDIPLTMAVRDWSAEHPDAGTEAELVAHLTAAGPFIPRGGDLAFLHHSIAEHVAATAEARELPAEFDPEHAVVAELLHQAKLLVEGRFARSVLLHYTHLHRDQADELLRRLHRGTSEQHLLAARLLGRHLPASPPVVDEFLTTVRGWAMTTQFRAALILARTSRATHHPGLADWLVGLLEDVEAPWESRAEAATALAVRLRHARAGEAIAFLRAGVENVSAPSKHRLIAAEALADSTTAERDIAERGLRSVLDDPLASGVDRSGAAVVLSAFGGEAREYAVTALLGMLSDVDTRVLDLVEVAVALAEIGLEFHDRCAEVFRAVVRDRAHSTEGRRQAAIGLASIGHPQTAAEALVTFINDRRIMPGMRSNAAVALASLGARQRAVAGELVLAQLTAGPLERRLFTGQLAGLVGREVAVEHLRKALCDPATLPSDVVTAAGQLAGLGPAFHEEAAGHLWRVLKYIDRSSYTFVACLRELANLDEPWRGDAMERIRVAMLDLRVDPENRCFLAADLIQRAPEHHAEAIAQLMLIAGSERDPAALFAAWNQLRTLGPALREQALPRLLAIARDQTPNGQLHNLGFAFAPTNTARRRAAAAVLTALLQDDARSMQTRLQAAQGLLWLGGAFHRTAVEGVARLIRSGAVLDTDFVARKFPASGAGVRATFAEALREVLDDTHHTGWSRARQALEALDVLGEEVPARAVRRLVDDQSADLDDRAWAAVMLSRTDSAYLPEAVALVLRACRTAGADRWRQLVVDVIELGADLRPGLEAMAHDRDRNHREAAAAAHLLGAPALPLLRRYAMDGHVGFLARSKAHQMLVDVDPSARQEAIDFHQSVLHDGGERVWARSAAAVVLAELDRSFQPAMSEVLWRFVESDHLELGERAIAAEYLSGLIDSASPRLARLIAGLAVHPEMSDSDTARLAVVLPRGPRTEVERFLLTDHSVDIRYRMPSLDVWDDLPLRAESEAAAREVLSAPEASASDRRKAAVALLQLSVRIDQDAVAVLLAQGTTAALVDAAARGAWERVHDSARAIVLDEARPMRERRVAALLIGEISDQPSVRDFLLEDHDAPWRMRIDELRFAAAHDDLRAIRDNPASSPAQRWRAAARLTDRSLDDLAACAEVFAAIAADPGVRPALRWRAAADLADLGERGRAQAKPLLEGIVRDAGCGVGARWRAASELCSRWPATRPEMLEALRELLSLARPLQRVQVLYTVGLRSRHEAVAGLRDMAADPRFGSLVRMRAAADLLSLRRDQRSHAAVVAREIASDPEVPRHLRVTAAGCLAEWSDECRADARALLVRLRDCRAR